MTVTIPLFSSSCSVHIFILYLFDILIIDFIINNNKKGSTVVIGSVAADIDQMIDTLAIFLTADERERSSYVVEGRKYIPDLLLQG
jgi:hypothetical protein